MALQLRHAFAGLVVCLAILSSTGCTSSKASPPCKTDGVACTAGSECCTGTCNQYAVCGATQTCKADGAITTEPAAATECCSHTGHYDTGSSQWVCGADGCKPNGDSCSVQGECCSNACTGTCVPIDTCWTTVGHPCGSDEHCCSNRCESGLCAASCLDGTFSCTENSQCCSTVCDSGTHVCTTGGGGGGPRPGGDNCTDGSQCRSGVCDWTGKCTSDVFCKNVGDTDDTCARASDCCSLTCTGGHCSTTACKPSGTGAESACSSGTQCCSGTCTGGFCAPVTVGGGGMDCTTLGNRCAIDDDCCSDNCQGGFCTRASSCNAKGDICYRDYDCCSGGCTTGNTGNPGRCEDSSGGCGQGGTPCDGASGCCTRRCADPGSGAAVCTIPSGCRMTGEYCDTQAACCGGTNTSYGGGNTSYNVTCSSKSGAPKVCDSGTGCNPPGNICGGGGEVNASQNCCYLDENMVPQGGGVLGHSACRPDSAGIMRCFGGPVTPDCNGWDGTDPNCCIQAGQVCQFSDQCCNGVPCVAGTDGVLRCAPTNSCVPQGGTCAGPVDTQDGCCADLVCRQVTIGGVTSNMCLDPLDPGGTCRGPGQSCGAVACCTGSCFEGVCAGCMTDGNACTGSAECCSSYCDPTSHLCAPPPGDGGQCLDATAGPGTSNVMCPTAGASCCTANEDCCSPATCVIPSGATINGTCTNPTVAPTCAETDQTCSEGMMPCCDRNQVCNGVCQPPPPECSDVAQTCTTDATCCPGLGLLCMRPNGNQMVSCTGAAGETGCSCVLPACIGEYQSCTPTSRCCAGLRCAEFGESRPDCGTTTSTDCMCVQAL